MNIRIPALMAAGILLVPLAGCDVDQTEEAEMPDVDVSADPGKLPDYDVVKKEEGELPDVDVDVSGGNMPEYDVETPDVDVETKTVEVPTLDVDMPDDEDDPDEVRERSADGN